MSHKYLLLVAVCALSLVSACAPAAPAAAPTSAARFSMSTDAAAEAEVREVIDQWTSAYNRDDAAGVAGVYAPNGVHIVGRAVEGRTAIQEVIARNMAASTDFVVSDRRFGVVADHAWETGVAEQTITPDSGQRYRLHADYVALLARQPDGSWKIQNLIAGNQRQQPLR